VPSSGTWPIPPTTPSSWRPSTGPTRPDALDQLVDRLLAAAPWLDCASYAQDIRGSHDVLDAVIAAMTARAAAQGQTFPPGEADLAAARTEGWIAVPDGPISRLR
jgi:hypothetical protein